jgi:hypothetical protein
MRSCFWTVAPALRSLPPETRAAIREQVHEAARPYHSGEGYDFPAVCLNVVAR